MKNGGTSLAPHPVLNVDGSVNQAPPARSSYVRTLGFWLILAIGVFMRFYHIDQREYWCDESYTSITISGHTRFELSELLASKHDLAVGDLRKFQQVEGAREKCLEDLITKGAQHPPIYYELARLWSEKFGCSVAAMRALPALLSLLVWPAAYWLCLEIFQSTSIAKATVALIAVSPVQVLFAQNAREYPLWLALACLTGALLLRSLRSSTFANWCAYSLTTTLALYTFPLQALVCAGQSLFLLLTEKWNRRRLLLRQLCALAAAALLYLPWLIALKNHTEPFRRSISWTTQHLSPTEVLLRLNNELNMLIVDIPQLDWPARGLLCAAGVAILWVFVRRVQSRSRIFVFCLIGGSLLPLLMGDLITGTGISQTLRYWLPSSIGVLMILAAAAVSLMESKSKALAFTGGTLLASAIAVCTASCIHDSTLDSHVNFSVAPNLKQVAETINKSNDPVYVVHARENQGELLSLCRLLRDDVRLHIVSEDTIDWIPTQNQQVFFFSTLESPIKVPFTLELRAESWQFGTVSRRELTPGWQ